MFKKLRFAGLGVLKKSTNEIVDGALDKQLSWRKTKKSVAIAMPAAVKKHETRDTKPGGQEKSRGWKAFWFPILCAAIIVCLVVWAFVAPRCKTTIIIPVVPEPTQNTVSVVDEKVLPSFDIVRVEKEGNIVIAGRYLPNQNVSIEMDKKIIATLAADKNGEFAHTKKINAGNHTIRLIAESSESAEDVFVYVAEKNPADSLSLLMTGNGSRMLQYPNVARGDLAVSKIDYLSSGRIVVSGNGLPRLRVSLILDGKELGFARVSDHKMFGLGADVGKLEVGRRYRLAVRMHDGDGNLAAEFVHQFAMPAPTGRDDTYYSVRRGDALWIIARNFLRRGVLFSMIVDANNIKNPDLIFPKQVLQIPVDDGQR